MCVFLCMCLCVCVCVCECVSVYVCVLVYMFVCQNSLIIMVCTYMSFLQRKLSKQWVHENLYINSKQQGSRHGL